VLIKQVHEEREGRLGIGRIMVELAKLGFGHWAKRVRRLARAAGLFSVHPRPYKATTVRVVGGGLAGPRRARLRARRPPASCGSPASPVYARGPGGFTSPRLSTGVRGMSWAGRSPGTRGRDWSPTRCAVFEYIESYCNRKRPHTRIGNLSPHEFELSFPVPLDSGMGEAA
jgi:hypothetical protein